MAKIQRVKAYTYKDHPIYKYRINVPSDIIKDLKWKEGIEIDFKIKDKKLEVFRV